MSTVTRTRQVSDSQAPVRATLPPEPLPKGDGRRGPVRSGTEPHSYRPLPIRASWIHILWPLLFLLAVIGIWALIAARYPANLVPGPIAVWNSFVTSWKQGLFLPAFGTTLEEAALGWAIGSAVALPLGYIVGRWISLGRTLGPSLAASQAMPIVAIAPLLAVWLGFGLEPKVVLAALIAFFPVMATTATGIRGVDRDLRDVARVFGAGWWQTAIYLEAPRAARSIFAGEKISATLAVTGAVVAEFVSSDQGLGFLVMLGRQNFDTPLVFVALISLMALGAGAYALLSLGERIVLTWTE